MCVPTVCVRVHTHTHTHTLITHMHTCTHTCIHARTHACPHSQTPPTIPKLSTHTTQWTWKPKMSQSFMKHAKIHISSFTKTAFITLSALNKDYVHNSSLFTTHHFQSRNNSQPHGPSNMW